MYRVGICIMYRVGICILVYVSLSGRDTYTDLLVYVSWYMYLYQVVYILLFKVYILYPMTLCNCVHHMPCNALQPLSPYVYDTHGSGAGGRCGASHIRVVSHAIQ
jgi:hypothetical protein